MSKAYTLPRSTSAGRQMLPEVAQAGIGLLLLGPGLLLLTRLGGPLTQLDPEPAEVAQQHRGVVGEDLGGHRAGSRVARLVLETASLGDGCPSPPPRSALPPRG
jgi:hypothetical protein